MAKQSAKSFFAVKVVAPRFGDSKKQSGPVAETMGPTKSMCEYGDAGDASKSGQLVIGSYPKVPVHGVAGHLTAVVHHFSGDDAAKCKSLAEAEQLMKKKHKAWLADAYDWFVMPAHVEPAAVPAKKPAKK
ncbi:MAG: hypothetical protein JNN20_09355 [Betaproteobacteria bacterium]|nr:hypothetical protein [Betaproteobacteria bacterium]